MNLLTRICGGTSSHLVMRDLKSALVNPAVRGILLAIDSPGGTVDGTQEIAQLVHARRRRGEADRGLVGLIGSAAYWIGSRMARRWRDYARILLTGFELRAVQRPGSNFRERP